MSTIKLIIADTKEIFREGVACLLLNNPEVEVLGVCANNLEALEKTRELQPDIIIMGIEPAESNKCIETIKSIYNLHIKTKIILMSCSPTNHRLFEMLKEGISGFIVKDSTIEDLIRTITLVDKGEIVIDSFIAQEMVRKFTHFRINKRDQIGVFDVLSIREREVLEMVARGASNIEIAQALFISKHTVKVHLHNIMSKLHACNRQQAVAFSINNI